MEAIYRDAFPDVFATFGFDEPSKFVVKDKNTSADDKNLSADISMIRLEDKPDVD